MDDNTEYVKSRRQQQELDKQYIRSRRKALGYEGDPLVNYLRGEFGIKPKPLPTQTKEVTFTYPNAQGKTVSSTETVPDYPINPTAIPKFQRAGPETPPEPRDVFSETGAAFLRSAVDLPRNLGSLGVGLFAGPEAAREFSASAPLPEGPQPTREDTAGSIANLTGGFIPSVLGGPPAFAGQSYREVNDRRQGESTGAELGAAVIGGAFGVVPIGNLLGKVPGLKQVVQRIGLAKFGKGLTEDTFNLIESFGLSKAQKAIGEQAIKATTSGLANVGQAAGTEYLARASGAEPVDFKPVEQFLGGFLGHGVLASVKGVSGHFENKRYRDFIKEAVNRKVLSPEEVALFGDNNREAAVETVLRRVNNEEVELVPLVDESGKPVLDESGRPRIGLKSKPDTVTWAEKVALEHNQDLIKTYRNALAKGGERIFIDTSRLPAREEQVTRVKTRLSELADQVRSALGVKDITEYGTPVTERALFYRDARIILDRLNDNPSRLDYDRAVALLAYGRNASKSLEPIPEARSIAAKQTDEILSPIKLRPTRQIEFPLELVNEKGYLADAKTLSQKPKTQEKIAAAQRGLLARVAALKAAKGFSDPQRLTVLRTIETEFVAKIDDLRNNDNTSTKARARVNRAIQDSALSEPQKASISQKLEQQFKDIDQNLTETQLGVIDRLVELNKDSPDTLQILEGLRQRVLSDESFAPASERVRLAREKIQTLAGQHLEIENLREKIVDVVKDLPENLKGTLYETTISAKTPQELKAILATVDQATERFIVADNANKVKVLTGKPLELNPQRDAVLEYLKSLQKLPLAQPIESVGPVAIKFTDPQTGATIIGKGKEHESHADVATRAIASTKDTKKIKAIVDTIDNDKNYGYISSRGRFIGREEAAVISQKVREVLEGKTSELPKPTEVEKPIVYFDENGKQKINQKNLQEFFNKLSSEQSTYVHDRIQSLIRQGQIERGLYQKYLKFSAAEDQIKLGKSLRALKDRKETGQDVRHLGALVADPVIYEAYLFGLAKSDPNNPLYQIYHGDLVPGMSRHNQNEANTQRFLLAAAKKFLGIDSSSLSGQQKLGRYLSEEIAPGIQRDKAMSIYALSTDEGRVNDLRKYGVVDHGKSIDVDTALASLSAEDRAFVDHVKGYFQNNAFVERAFSLFLLLNGYSPQRFKGFFPSSRSPEKTTLDPDFGTFATTLLNSIDPLKERLENVGKPYNIDKGFYSSFNQATHQLSLFAELGESLYRAQKAFVNEEFKDLFTKKQGRANYESMNLYLSNIYGQVGHSRTVFDQAVDKTIQGFSVSRTALNVYSAAKQIMHVATVIADGSLPFTEVAKSIASGSWLKESVSKEMQQNSGLAYQRYHGHFLREMMVTVDQGKAPSLLDVVQHKSMLFQRAVDRATMQITWDAARRTAYKNGYRGDALKAETVRLFEISAGRDQPTSNPLYASELEIHAKRQPLLRGSLLFMREQNRIYNVVRRHTLTALQNPTADNIHNALRAVVFGVIVNAAGIVGINALRRATFGKPQDERDFTMDALSNIIGMYYLAAPLEPLMEAFVKGTTTARSHASDNLISPIGSLVLDATKGAFALGELAFGEGGKIKSGPQRGMSKEKRELVNLLDSSSSLVSGFFGLPLWSIWQQAKGLYNWTNDQVRLMTRVEHERQLLKQTDPGSTRLRVIESTMKKVNEIHRKREKGTLSPSQAQDQIEAELSQLVD